MTDANNKISDPDRLSPEDEEELRRRKKRVRLRMNNVHASGMYDQVIILVAVLVAFFMVYTRGCDRSMQGLTRLLDESGEDSSSMNNDETDTKSGQAGS